MCACLCTHVCVGVCGALDDANCRDFRRRDNFLLKFSVCFLIKAEVCSIDIYSDSRFNHCEIESWSLFFQFSGIVFLAILKATSIGVVFWLDVSISDESK